jgi:sugar phosphate permease
MSLFLPEIARYTVESPDASGGIRLKLRKTGQSGVRKIGRLRRRLGVWAPQIIKNFGLSNMEVGLLNAVPPTIAVVAMYLWSWYSDRTNERTWHVVIACLAAAAGVALAGLSSGVASVVAALVLVNVGISAAKPPV